MKPGAILHGCAVYLAVQCFFYRSLGMNIHVTATEPSFAEVLYKVVLTLECGLNLVREIKTTEQNCGGVSFALQGDSDFWVSV